MTIESASYVNELNASYPEAGSNVQDGDDHLRLVKSVLKNHKLRVQSVRTDDSAQASTTTAIPNDDTIPQNTEGAEAFTVTITPKHASNILKISAKIAISNNGANSQMAIALFKDSDTDAIAAIQQFTGSANLVGHVCIDHEIVAGGTSAITFKLRYGASSGTSYMNGNSGRKMGGVMESYIQVEEFLP